MQHNLAVNCFYCLQKGVRHLVRNSFIRPGAIGIRQNYPFQEVLKRWELAGQDVFSLVLKYDSVFSRQFVQ